MTIPQDTFTVFHAAAYPGMLCDNHSLEGIVSYRAAVAFQPGLVLELNGSGQVQPPIAGSANKIAGVGVYLSTNPPGGYQAGDMVPVLRKGRVWVTGNGAAAATDGDALRLYVNGAHGGKLTTDALLASNVIASAAVACKHQSFGSATLVAAEFNLP
jgi:hypothetical protein